LRSRWGASARGGGEPAQSAAMTPRSSSLPMGGGLVIENEDFLDLEDGGKVGEGGEPAQPLFTRVLGAQCVTNVF